MVNLGDSLWSISQRVLGPNATPQQIANEVERIFELNRNQIGDDPNQIVAGQELVLSPATSEPAANEPATNAQAAGEVAPNEPAADALVYESAQPAASQTLGNEPAVGSYPNIPLASWLDERRLLDFGILALSLVLVMLILWKAPLWRDVGGEAWRIMPATKEYPANYSASQGALTATGAERPAFALFGSENGSSGGFGNRALTNGQIPHPVAVYLTVDEAAKVLGITPDAVYIRIQQGTLPASKRGRCGTIYLRLYCV
jgi:excisionase family DNA binding protein